MTKMTKPGSCRIDRVTKPLQSRQTVEGPQVHGKDSAGSGTPPRRSTKPGGPARDRPAWAGSVPWVGPVVKLVMTRSCRRRVTNRFVSCVVGSPHCACRFAGLWIRDLGFQMSDGRCQMADGRLQNLPSAICHPEPLFRSSRRPRQGPAIPRSGDGWAGAAATRLNVPGRS